MDPGSSSPPEREPDPVPNAPSVWPPSWGIGDFFWIYVAGIVASLVFGQIGFAITGDHGANGAIPERIGALTTALSTFGQFGVWFGLLFYIARTKGRSLRDDFGFTLQTRDWWAPFLGIGLFGIGSFLIAPIVSLVNESQQVVQDLDHASGPKLAVFAVVAALVAPICEELLFRGLLLRALRRRMSPELAVIVQALAFALAHPMLSPTLGDLAVVPALFMLGAVSGVVAVRKENLSASIMMHIGFNLVTTIAAVWP